MDFIVNKDLKHKRTIEYCRKSTDSEDRQVFSLDDQDNLNQKTSERYSLKIVKKYKESASAKQRGRIFFNEMIGVIEQEKAEVILTWALNRLARNAVDGALLIELMDQKKLFAIVTPGKVYYNSGDDKLLLQIEFGLAKKYSDDLSPTIKRGMHSKAQRGWWPTTPKLGYINVNENGDEPKQTVDPVRFPLLRKAIDLFLTGGYSVNDILTILNEKWGFKTRRTKRQGEKKLSKTRFYEFLKDTYNYGEMVWGEECYKVHDSVPRIVTNDEYWRIQELLGRVGVKRPQKHFDLPFRGLFRCGECGSVWIPYTRPKKLIDGSVKNYCYIRCNHDSASKTCDQKQISFHIVEQSVKEILDSITIPDEFYNWVIKWLKEDHKDESGTQQLVLSNLNKSLESNQKKLNRLLDLHIEGIISKEEYQDKKEELKNERLEIEKEQSSLKARTYDWLDLAERTFNFAKNAKYHFDHGDAETKTAIIRSLGSNFLIKDEKVLIELSKPFFILKENHNSLFKEAETIELNNQSLTITKSDHFEAAFSNWWTYRELNPDFCNANAVFFR